MSLDAVSLPLIAPLLSGAWILCLGDPDMPAGHNDLTFAAYAYKRGVLKVDCVDVIAHKGHEEIVDLNLRHAWRQRYDLVINPGTLEHCFNIGQAWANAWSAVGVGGHILNVAPVTMLNHGYWNINPIAFTDWCVTNGGHMLDIRFACNGNANKHIVKQPIPSSKSGRGMFPPETVAYCLMKKIKDVEMCWPAQWVYR
jgi:hypothetical protein